MIDLHYWPTPNGHKVTMFLEEAGLPYCIIPVDIGAGEQFQPDFLAIAPNNRMPAIVDQRAGRRRRADLAVRVRRDPALSRGEDRPVPSRPTCAAGPSAAMAVLADGRPGADGRARTTTSRIRAREDPLRDRPLRQRDQPALRRAGPAPGRPALRGGRVFDRRHGGLSVDRPLRAPGPEPRRLPEPEALVRDHRGAAGACAPMRGRPRSIPSPP